MNAASPGTMAQIEDPEAIDAIDAIAAAEEIDAVRAAGLCADRPTGLFLAREGDAPNWAAKGARLFLFGSDHGFMPASAAALAARVRGSD